MAALCWNSKNSNNLLRCLLGFGLSGPSTSRSCVFPSSPNAWLPWQAELHLDCPLHIAQHAEAAVSNSNSELRFANTSAALPARRPPRPAPGPAGVWASLLDVAAPAHAAAGAAGGAKRKSKGPAPISQARCVSVRARVRLLGDERMPFSMEDRPHSLHPAHGGMRDGLCDGAPAAPALTFFRTCPRTSSVSVT